MIALLGYAEFITSSAGMLHCLKMLSAAHRSLLHQHHQPFLVLPYTLLKWVNFTVLKFTVQTYT
jgi:hypothetical protein